MNENIIKIDIDTVEGGASIAIDNTQTSIATLVHGIIAGALKAVYSPLGCGLIADYLSVSAGLKKSTTFYQEHTPFMLVANRVLAGVKQLFDGYDDRDLKVKCCCRYIIDEITSDHAFIMMCTKETELYMD